MTPDRRLVYVSGVVTADTTRPVDVAGLADRVRAKHHESM
jgi:hypothetical protein